MSRGRPPTPRSPQEKKALSYARDRRNSYGESPKGARKAIPQRKAMENRGARRKVSAELQTIGVVDESAVDLIESDARNDVQRVGGWKKCPDIPLGEQVAHKANARAGRPVWNRLRRQTTVVEESGPQDQD